MAADATPPRRSPQLLVGLITSCALGILLLYGFGIGPDEVQRGWETVLRMTGGA
ncbi:hypothetical protein HC891_14595 [Candidatus Gracilibacteria bacterium]|nr:hypothetical protein [Candidatus Gracilibacteria bacterium]